MKNLFSQIAAACLLAAFAISTPIYAQEKKERKAPEGIPMRGKLTAVDTQNKTITVGGKEKDRVFQVTSQTKIQKEGKPATLADAKVDEKVTGYAVKAADDKYELRSLYIGQRPESEKKEGEKREKKADGEKKKKE